MKNKNKILKITFITLIYFFLFIFIFNIFNNSKDKTIEYMDKQFALGEPKAKSELANGNINAQKENNQVIYLSDIKYQSAKVGWGSISLDKTSSNTEITLMLNGTQAIFKKGIFAHATSEVVYDISAYKNDYAYFTTYYGVNTTSGNRGNGVKFFVQTSVDGKNWTTVTDPSPNPLMSSNNAGFIKVDIKNVNYLKLWAHDNGSNGNDHSVWADSKLIKEGYNDNVTMTVEEYDTLIKEKYSNSEIDDELELLILQRDFVNNVGQYTLRTFCEESEQNREVFDWLFNNLENLRLYIMGGKPTGTYIKSLQVLSELYSNYKNDLTITETTKYGTVLGDLYKRMTITLSLTHSAQVALWMQPGAPENQSDAVTRYAIYKKMHADGKFKATDSVDITPWFETYNIEEMRYVMNTLLDDEEIVWLNEYTQSFIDSSPNSVWGYLTPHPYMAYVWPNYGNPVYYDEENIEYFDQLFNGVFSKYNVTRGTSEHKVYKLWMNFRNKFGTGAVCGGISKSGHCIRGVHAIPSAVIGQPGHAALLYYTRNTNGQGYWGIDNDVSGWTLSEKGERLPLGWGNDRSYVKGYNVPYIVLAQEVMNDYDNLIKAEELVKLAQSYSDNPAKQEELYRKAIAVQSINLDAWVGLVKLYTSDTTKTEEQYYNLSEEMMEALKLFPFTMHNLSETISPKFTSDVYKFKFTLLQTRILTEGKNYQGTDVLQPGITRGLAASLLGNLDTSLASFSFDGEDAGKIILSSRFDGNGIRWDYSLDGKKTWKEVAFTAEEEHKLQLTEEEIKSITSENDIYVHIVGVNYSEENLYKIDILESAGLPSTLYANDWENRLISATPTIQWKYREEDEWIYYGENEPDLTGDKDIIVKAGATGVYLAATNSITYHFTEDNQPNTRKYIPVSHLSIHSVSSEATAQGRNATNAIDANIKTNWHSAWNGSDREKTIIIKLDEPKNLCALEFFPVAGGNGKIVDAVISVSMDGENWTEVVSETNWTYANSNDITPKSVDFEPTRGQYVKIVGKRTQAASSSMSFMAVSMFNFYEDKTAKIVAEFSFDGNNAGRISLFDEYKNKNWKYSIDGGNTWKDTEADSHQLSTEEINQINEENKIKILFYGDETQYKINIKKGNTPQSAEYVNDLENRLIGISNTNTLEWKIDDGNWTSYEEKEPIVTGSRTLFVRKKATGIYTASDSVEYQFTEDNQPRTAKYISIKNLSIHSYSTQSVDTKRPYYAPNIIDGNINTQWHTDFRYSIANTEAFIAIELNQPKYISKLEYVHMDSTKELYGHMKNGVVYVSEDGENWIEAARIENIPKDDEVKSIAFNESVYGKYVKLVIQSHDNVFASAAMINLFEDKTKDITSIPTAEIDYSTKTLTNKDVVITLVNPSTEITIKNNNGSDTYTFTKNGEFTFEFEDQDGNKGTATAKVDWIDKEAPTAEFEYNITENTINPVTVTLKPSEDVTITNNNGSDAYTFGKNGEFTFKFEDKAGNKGIATAKVDWIKEPTKIKVTYNIKEITNEDVTVTIVSENSKIEITNNNGSNTYTFSKNGTFNFEYIDEYDVSGSMTIMVDWIDKDAPTAEFEYSTRENTTEPVTVTLKPSEKVTITNNDEKDTYTFNKNGEFTFEFVDKAGNKGTATVNVDWIKDPTKVNIDYDIKTLTNKNVVATIKSENSKITIDNNDGSNKYTFTKNGAFTFKYTDEYGQKGETTAYVDWIDKVAPIATFDYNIKHNTANPVKATLIPSEEITILNNDGKNTIVFNDNGSFTFEFVDNAGNKGTATANVDWIRKIPGLEFVYSTNELTNEDVEVTLIVSNVKITITNNNGSNTHVFTENGNFTFEYVDEYGQKGQTTARVNWIDKENPTVDIKYNKTTLTNENVIATLKFSEEITIINEDLKFTKNEDGTYTVIFEENSKYCLEFEDKVGNKGKASIDINWIDKEAPIGELEYSTKNITLDPVTVTLKANENIKILNNNGSDKYTFNQNGEFTFEFEDEAGNKGTATANVNWIRTTLKVKLVYSIDTITNNDVLVTLVTEDPNEYINITNNNGSNTYTFTQNGEFTFEYVGGYGIPNSITAKVDWIDKKVPTAKIEYDITSTTKENVIATIRFDEEVKALSEDAYLVEYEDNVFKLRFEYNSSRVIEFVDKAGNEVIITLDVNWIDKTVPTAEVEYSTTEITNKDVIATVKFSEDVIILNQDLDIIDIEDDGNYIIRFNENGKYTIEFVDKAGNKGSTIVEVNNIDKDIPTAEVEYSTTETTNKDVTATIKFNEEVEILTENIEIEKLDDNTYIVRFKENDEIVIKYKDKAENIGSTILKVEWIQILPIINVSYDITTETKENVTVTITSDDLITITNNDGKNTYTFNENGEFIFEYIDKYGNEGKAITKVDWIVKDTEKPVEPIKPVDPIKPSETDKDKPYEDNNQVNKDKLSENNNQVDKNNAIINNQTSYKPNYSYEANASENVNNNLIESEYNYSTGDIIIKVSSKQDIKSATLINKKLVMDNKFENKVGKASEYFELYLENGNKDKIDLEPSNISIRFKLDSSKVFATIYKVNDDNTLEKVEYEVVDEDNIMINTKNLGKYILSYNEKEPVELQSDNKLDTSNKVKKSAEIIKHIVFVIMVIVIAVLFSLFRFITKSKQQ